MMLCGLVDGTSCLHLLCRRKWGCMLLPNIGIYQTTRRHIPKDSQNIQFVMNKCYSVYCLYKTRDNSTYTFTAFKYKLYSSWTTTISKQNTIKFIVFVGFDVLTVVTMRYTVSWECDDMHSPVKSTYVSDECTASVFRVKSKSGKHVTCLAYSSTFEMGQYMHLKHRWTTRPHDNMSQKTVQSRLDLQLYDLWSR